MKCWRLESAGTMLFSWTFSAKLWTNAIFSIQSKSILWWHSKENMCWTTWLSKIWEWWRKQLFESTLVCLRNAKNSTSNRLHIFWINLFFLLENYWTNSNNVHLKPKISSLLPCLPWYYKNWILSWIVIFLANLSIWSLHLVCLLLPVISTVFQK